MLCYVVSSTCPLQVMFTAPGNVVTDSPSQSVEHISISMSSQADETAAVHDDSAAADVNNTPCAVCLDNGSGFHYGVYSCEGCKVGVSDSSYS